MKKLLIFLVALSLLTLCGCSSNSNSEATKALESTEFIEHGEDEDEKHLLQSEENEIIYSTETEIPETAVCNACHGEGTVTCEDCGGNGEVIVIFQHETEVRNDYVCEVCGGKGWLNDGLHGGKTANCDFCGGLDGKMPSGDFNKKAYDRVMVGEEGKGKCEACDGQGSVKCRECGMTASD